MPAPSRPLIKSLAEASRSPNESSWLADVASVHGTRRLTNGSESLMDPVSNVLASFGNEQSDETGATWSRAAPARDDAASGCAKNCHGQSLASGNDEDNVVPPDASYAPAAMEPAGVKCRDVHNAPAKAIVCRQERCLGKTHGADLVCTHSQHRLKVPTVWWDTEARKPVVYPNNQQAGPAPAALKTAGGSARR